MGYKSSNFQSATLEPPNKNLEDYELRYNQLLTATPLLRVKAKITVKNPVCRSRTRPTSQEAERNGGGGESGAPVHPRVNTP